jgi:hypothetical protein
LGRLPRAADERDRSLFRKLRRVPEQVQQNLPRQHWVGRHGAELGAANDEPVLVLCRERRDSPCHFVQHRPDVEGLERERHFACLDFRQVKNPVDQLE